MAAVARACRISLVLFIVLASDLLAKQVETQRDLQGEVPGSSLLLNSVIADLERQYREVWGVQVTGSKVEVFEGSTPQGPWEPSKYRVEGSAAVEARRGGRYRITLDRYSAPWVEGRAAVLDENKDVSFDGKERLEVSLGARYQRSAAAKEGTSVTAIVSGEPGPERTADLISGLFHGRMTAWGFFDHLPQTGASHLASALRLTMEQGRRLEASWVEDEGGEKGRSLVLVVQSTSNSNRRLWFDPGRRHALTRFEEVLMVDGTNRLSRAGRVIAWHDDPAVGYSYPLRSELLVRVESADAKPFYRRSVVTSDRVILNPELDELVVIRLKTGTRVTDYTSGETYTVSASPRERAMSIDDRIASIKRASQGSGGVGAGPLGLVAAAKGEGSTAEVSTAGSGSAARSGRLWVFVAAVAGAVGLAFVVLAWVRRGKAKQVLESKQMLGLFMTVGVVLVAAHSAVAQLNGGPLEKPYRSNCGVDAVYTLLRWFDAEPQIEEIASRLSAGDRWERAVSMASISDLLVSEGFEVRAVAIKDMESLLSLANRPMVVRLPGRPGKEETVGHLMVLIPVDGKVAVFDGDTGAAVLRREELAGTSLSRVREVLVCTPPVQGASKLGLSSEPIELVIRVGDGGAVSERLKSDSAVEVAVIVSNSGEGVLRLSEGEPCCGTPTLRFDQRVIKQGDRAKVTATFGGIRAEEATHYKAIRFLTNDPAQREVRIPVVIKVVGGSGEVGMRLSHQSIDWGVIAKGSTEKRQSLSVWVVDTAGGSTAPDVKVVRATDAFGVELTAPEWNGQKGIWECRVWCWPKSIAGTGRTTGELVLKASHQGQSREWTVGLSAESTIVTTRPGVGTGR